MQHHGTHRAWLIAAALSLAGCPTEDPVPDPTEPHPCAAAWGEAPTGGRLHVSPGGDGDGSLASPYGSLADALAESRIGEDRQIALDAGEHDAALLLSSSLGDDGLSIVGCGRELTTLAASPDAGGLPQSAIDITGATTRDIAVRGLAITGGRRSVVLRGGAGSEGAIVLRDLDVLDSARIGIMIDGASTLAELRDVLVQDVVAEAGQYGWGIALQIGRQLSIPFPAPVVLADVDVIGAEGIGILVDGGWVDMERVTVQDTASIAGALGRGVQLQSWSFGTITGLLSTDNSDSAVFLESPGRPDLGDLTAPPLAVELLDSVLGPTSLADVPGAPDQAADGLAATQDATGGQAYPADTFRVVLDGTDLGGNSRAHVLVETVVIEVGPNNVFGKGAGYPIAVQGAGLVQGLGGGAATEEFTELAEIDALGLNRATLSLDELVE